MGLSQSSYDAIKNRFLTNSIVTNTGKKGWSSLLANCGGVSDTNKKYFIYGLALHSATDVLAHSTCLTNGSIIAHKNDHDGDGVWNADDPEYMCDRWYDAKCIAKYIMDYCVKNADTIRANAFMAPSYNNRMRNYRIANIAYYAAKNLKDYSNLSYYTNNVFSCVNYRWGK